MGRSDGAVRRHHVTTDAEQARVRSKRRFRGIFIGLALAILVYIAMPDQLTGSLIDALNDDGSQRFTAHGLKLTAATAVLMAAWWVTEAIPLPGTALLPLIIFPLAFLLITVSNINIRHDLLRYFITGIQTQRSFMQSSLFCISGSII